MARHGLQATFGVLAATENESADAVLIAALDSPELHIQEETLRAILRRRSLSGQREVLRRLHLAGDRWRAILAENRHRLTGALRDAVASPEPQTCANGCDAVLWFAEYDLVPALISAAEDPANPNSDRAAHTLLALAEMLYHELAAPRDYQQQPRDPQRVRRHVLTSLELSLPRWPIHKRNEVIEATLILANRDNALLKKILKDPHDRSYLAVVDAVTHSPRPGVMRLLLSYLEDPTAPSAALGILAHRTDPVFVGHLLRKIGHEPSAQAAHNLKRLDNFAWLRGEMPLIERLEEAAQHSAMQMVLVSGMKHLEQFRIVAQLLRRGKPAGRRAAAVALKTHIGAEANTLVLAALEDPDPQVKALALSQLRPRGIPGSMPRLLEQVDSPHEVVRETVRAALAEFSFERFLHAFEMLEDDARQNTGALVRKLDPRTMPSLVQELRSRSRSRRLRGIGVAIAIEAVVELEDVLVSLLADEDHMVRVEACRALSCVDSPAVREALVEALADRSQTVREAAQASLEVLT